MAAARIGGDTETETVTEIETGTVGDIEIGTATGLDLVFVSSMAGGRLDTMTVSGASMSSVTTIGSEDSIVTNPSVTR